MVTHFHTFILKKEGEAMTVFESIIVAISFSSLIVAEPLSLCVTALQRGTRFFGENNHRKSLSRLLVVIFYDEMRVILI